MLSTYLALCPPNVIHASKQPCPFYRSETQKESPHCSKYYPSLLVMLIFGRCWDSIEWLRTASPTCPWPTYPELRAWLASAPSSRCAGPALTAAALAPLTIGL